MRERARAVDGSGLPNGRGTVVTVGTFDGVHLGHRDVLARIVARAREMSLDSVLVTFDPHPLEVVNPTAAPLLLTIGEEKLEVVAESGVRYMAIVPFTPVLQRYSAAQFVDEVLRHRFHVKHLVIGHDHGFGRGREGDVDVMRALGHERGFGVEVVNAVATADGRVVSSTLIRRAVAGGDLHHAAQALGRPYSVQGRVRRGDQRGRALGFPTVNLGSPPARKLLPPDGVYAVRAQTPAGAFGGMMNLGGRPTFGDHARSLEVHLFDTDIDLYGASVRVDFMERLRETRAFAGPDELKTQLRRDGERARAILARRVD
ncbi:MAG TPA: bifunctional riboflavin kinase/FAD synthetase [Gemmatimonadaceae bacterium]